MSTRRALVDCVVLSLQDACMFYPCCKGCFSRTDVDLQDTTRCRCSKCGYSCLREQVDYRYRLSMKVTRDGCIFGVTVFGTCLNPFFGINASGLQRLLENLDGPAGPSNRSTLLLKAVEDCFIGRRFIFGIKVTGTETVPWLGGPVVNGSSSKDTIQFIASQMILPNASGLGGCTVVRYYQILLQKAAEFELESSEPSKASRLPATTLLLIPPHSLASSFSNSTLCASRLLSPSLQRSQHQDCTLTPTPPWQQSLGLVTSSAEQEEGCSTQDSGDDNSRQTDNNEAPHCTQRDCWEDHKATEETVLSPVVSIENSFYSHASFVESPHLSIEKAVGNTPILNTCFSPSSTGHNSSKGNEFSTSQLTKTSLPSSLAWEDLPFSESFSEFLCEENKDFDVIQIEPHVNVQNQTETTRKNLERQDKSLSVELTSVFQSNTQITDSHSWKLVDITNTPAGNGGGRHDLSYQVCKSISGKASSLSFEDEGDEKLEDDTYNCSADLFSSPLMNDMSANTLNTHAETVRTATEACRILFKPDKLHLRSEKVNVPHLTPKEQKLKSNKWFDEASLIPPGMQDLNFIPPSQSTPIAKVAGSHVCSNRTLILSQSSPDSQDSCAFYRNVHELDSKKPAQITCSLCKLSCASANQLCRCGGESSKQNLVWSTTSSRHCQRLTPKRRFWKQDKHKKHLLAQPHLRFQRRALNTGSTGRINHKCDSSYCNVTLCDFKDIEAAIIPPTPAVKTGQCVNCRGRRGSDSSSLGFMRERQQGDEVNCKRTLLDPTLKSSQRGLAQTGNCDSETVDEGTVDGPNCYLLDDENEAGYWSRDLFSDSL